MWLCCARQMAVDGRLFEKTSRVYTERSAEIFEKTRRLKHLKGTVKTRGRKKETIVSAHSIPTDFSRFLFFNFLNVGTRNTKNRAN